MRDARKDERKENTRHVCGMDIRSLRILGYLAAHSDMSRHHHPPQTDMSRQGLQLDMG